MLDGAAAQQIARLFDLGTNPILSRSPVAKGKQGVVWRLDTDAGSWAVKEPFRRTEEAEVRQAADFQRSAKRSGVPTPGVVPAPGGRVLADIGPTQVRVYEWVDLLGPDITLDPVGVGAAVAAVHRVFSMDGDPLDPWYCEPVGAARWDDLIAALRAARAPFAQRLADVRDELVALDEWIEAPGSLQVCHRDLWADNLLPTPTGDICIIDWENCGLADPSQELGCVLFEFAAGDPGRSRALYESYLASGGPGRVERPGHFSMLIAQLGHIGEIACRDWLEPNVRSPDRSDSAAWFSEFVDRPHHRAVLQEILDAIG
jgi:aminoglycoside phosphotransferase (APT) family kinase protein